MHHSLQNVIVIGATGNVGQPIVDALLRDGTFHISALRRPNSTSFVPPGVQIKKSDYSHDSLVAAFKGQDVVISTIATSHLLDQQRIIDAAVVAGVKRFVPSDFGAADTSSSSCLQYAPCLKPKMDVVDYLKTKEQNKLSWTTFITGIWFDWSLVNPHWTFWDLDTRTFTLFDDGDTPFEASTLAQVAEGVVAALKPEHAETTTNRCIHIDSFTLTQNQVLRSLEHASGKKWKVVADAVVPRATRGQDTFFRLLNGGQPLEKLLASEELGMAIVDIIVAGMFGNGGINQFGDKAEVWNGRLGLQRENVDEVVNKALATYSK